MQVNNTLGTKIVYWIKKFQKKAHNQMLRASVKLDIVMHDMKTYCTLLNALRKKIWNWLLNLKVIAYIL